MKKLSNGILSLIVNIFLLPVSLYFSVTAVALTDWWERYPVHIPEFIMCAAFMLISFALPITANLLLYKFWYKKSGMSKLWLIIPLSAIYLILVFLLIAFLISIPEWGSLPYEKDVCLRNIADNQYFPVFGIALFFGNNRRVGR